MGQRTTVWHWAIPLNKHTPPVTLFCQGGSKYNFVKGGRGVNMIICHLSEGEFAGYILFHSSRLDCNVLVLLSLMEWRSRMLIN